MLSLTAENEKLRQTVAKLILANENLLRKAPSTRPKPNIEYQRSVVISVEKLRDNKIKDEFEYYTGLKSCNFIRLHQFLIPPFSRPAFKMSKKMSGVEIMSTENQLLLVLSKLRQDFDFIHIGKLFGLSAQDSSTLFSNWIQYMYFRCSSVCIWPHRDAIIAQMPKNYKLEFPNTMVIIDGTELKVQRPSSLTRQSQCYSDYKSCTTLKGLVGVDPRGSLMFSSMLFTGGISDKEITHQSGFLKLLDGLVSCGKLNRGDGVMADKGFTIREEIESRGLRLNIPPFARSGSRMAPADVSLTEKNARHHVHVERAIARIKKFKIVSGRIDLTLFSIVNQIWFCCCFVTNFMPYLIKEK